MPALATLSLLPLYARVTGEQEAKAEIGPTLLAISVGVILGLIMFFVGICRSAASMDLEHKDAEAKAKAAADDIKVDAEEKRRQFLSEQREVVHRIAAGASKDAERTNTLQLFNRLLDHGKQLNERLRTELHTGVLLTPTIEQCSIEVEAWRLSVNTALADDHLQTAISSFIPSKDRNEVRARLNTAISAVENARTVFMVSGD